MPSSSSDSTLSGRETFDGALSGQQPRPFIPPLSSDAKPKRLARSLPEFRSQESPAQREARLRALWATLPKTGPGVQPPKDVQALMPPVTEHSELTRDRAELLRDLYLHELLGRCNGKGKVKGLDWEQFQQYAHDKEAELWTIFHDELDLDGNGHLDADELRAALRKSGIKLSDTTLSEFIAFLTSSPHSQTISFPEFRDFLLLLPRKASTIEIFRYYEVRKFMGDDGRGAARVNMEGDVSLSAEDRPPPAPSTPHDPPPPKLVVDPHRLQQMKEEEGNGHDHEDDHDHHEWLGGAMALKFLAAGGIAGAVSRTATAPFDRLKVFLITRNPEVANGNVSTARGAKAIVRAIGQIYAEGGITAFWIGNGLNLAKIFPESAIKFLSYESSKRAFAKYWDHVEDSRDISGTSRFISGGIGGITSQLAIYPIETLKTQVMSTSGGSSSQLIPAMKRLWALGGVRAYYRGLVIGLVGVFPYSAIDMSTFEALKLAYLRSTGKEEPGVLATLAFGSISGSVGATSVYPLNLVRTRLQAAGSPGHPQRYTGMWDVTTQTMQRDGWRGFYRGLFPTLAKVVPAVSISYVVYEESKRRLGV